MLKQLWISARMTLLLLLLVSGLYPLVVWGLSQGIFPKQANGSLAVSAGGTVVGSRLLAQGFTKPQYFHPRPSAAGSGYDPTSSGGTNLGPTSAKLLTGVHNPKLADGKDDPANFDGVGDLAKAYRAENGLPADAPAPVDAVTRSASGLDPDISLPNAEAQAARVAEARGVAVDDIRRLIQTTAKGRGLGFLSEPRVNALEANLNLDKQYPVNRH